MVAVVTRRLQAEGESIRLLAGRGYENILFLRRRPLRNLFGVSRSIASRKLCVARVLNLLEGEGEEPRVASV